MTESRSKASHQPYCSWGAVGEDGAGVLGETCLRGETVLTSKKILGSVFSCSFSAFSPLAHAFRSIGFCNVYTCIYNYIEQSSSGSLEVFSVFRLLVTARTWHSFSAGPSTDASEPQKHMTLESKGRPRRGFLASSFWRLNVQVSIL